MGQKAGKAGYGQLDSHRSQRPSPNNKGQEPVNASDVVLLITVTHPCVVCGKATHGWGTLDGDQRVCSKNCHVAFVAKKTLKEKSIRKKVALVAGPDGILRPVNLPTKSKV